MEEITGAIEHIVFANPDNGFTVAKIKEKNKRELTCIVGIFAELKPGETVVCRGEWKHHSSFGKQFEVKEHSITSPSDLVGIKKYLESGLVRGVGEVYADKIVSAFGLETLQIIDLMPQRLLEIPGIGKKRLEKIIECWQAQKSIREVMIFLRSFDISPSFAQKIYKQYGNDSIAVVKENPYRMAKEVFGIGFKIADTIAAKIGFAKDCPVRIEGGVEHVLWELTNNGHTRYPIEIFTPLAQKILEVDESLITAAIQKMAAKNYLTLENDYISLRFFTTCEQSIADELLRIKLGDAQIRQVVTEKAIEWVQNELRIDLAFEQKEAVIRGVTQKAHIITGGPGTGKSTITKAILEITSKITNKILLCAPTGKAAKRLGQITGKKAFTIHSVLEYDFANGSFKKGPDNPLKYDLIIIDEASMIDTSLMFYLLRAIPVYARILFIGDIDQLPSVGPGYVLKDMIASGCVGITRLEQIFRQAAGSQIIANAHRINRGEFPDISSYGESDFLFFEAKESEQIEQTVVKLLTSTLPSTYHFHPVNDIQVIAPMKRGRAGTENLNQALQNALNPSTRPLVRAGGRLHTGDKVMQICNNYNKDVFNGDVGTIMQIDTVEQVALINFDGNIVDYEFSELDEIVLAYAVSVHKFQGSECPCVVIPIHTSHYKLLLRNLLYTAVTRGKKMVVLVGTKQAIGIAIKNNDVLQRHTGLEIALRRSFKNQEIGAPGAD